MRTVQLLQGPPISEQLELAPQTYSNSSYLSWRKTSTSDCSIQSKEAQYHKYLPRKSLVPVQKIPKKLTLHFWPFRGHAFPLFGDRLRNPENDWPSGFQRGVFQEGFSRSRRAIRLTRRQVFTPRGIRVWSDGTMGIIRKSLRSVAAALPRGWRPASPYPPPTC